MARLLSTVAKKDLSEPPGHVLLGGGTGFIGTAFQYLLKSMGYNITVISRMPGPQRRSWFDIRERGIPDNITAVVNLAGQNILDPSQRWTPGFKQNVKNSRVNTTSTLAKAISNAKNKPNVFVSISGVGIYQPSGTVEYDETSSIGKPFDFLSEVAVEWEQAAKLPPDSNCRNVIIRSGVVLGRGGGMIKQMYPAFFFGLGGPMGSGNQFLPWIHLKDLCNLLLFAIEKKQVVGVLNGVAPQIITNQEFSTAFANAMGRPAFFRVPETVLNIMFNEERAKIITQGQKVLPKRVVDYGFQYEYPNIVDACKECARLMYSSKEPLPGVKKLSYVQ